jgi:hypothetical protein
MKQNSRVSNATLQRALRDKTREAEILHRVSETVSGNLDLDAVLHDIVDIAVEVTKKGRPVALDARPLIQEFLDVGRNGTPAWQLTLRVGPGGSVKPTTVMRSFLEQRVPPGHRDPRPLALGTRSRPRLICRVGRRRLSVRRPAD